MVRRGDKTYSIILSYCIFFSLFESFWIFYESAFSVFSSKIYYLKQASNMLKIEIFWIFFQKNKSRELKIECTLVTIMCRLSCFINENILEQFCHPPYIQSDHCATLYYIATTPLQFFVYLDRSFLVFLSHSVKYRVIFGLFQTVILLFHPVKV